LSALVLQGKRGKNGGSVLNFDTGKAKSHNCRSILQNFLQQISHPLCGVGDAEERRVR